MSLKGQLGFYEEYVEDKSAIDQFLRDQAKRGEI